MRKTLILLIVFGCLSCSDYDPNLNKQGEDILEAKEIYVSKIDLNYRDSVYIPIYSDIYSVDGRSKTLLNATLSIRNTSVRDGIYIEDIDYYDSKGKLVRSYIDGVILLKPLETIEYVVDYHDETGGTGANFIVNWGSQNPQVTPVFQGVMISTSGQHGLSFVTEGVSISERK